MRCVRILQDAKRHAAPHHAATQRADVSEPLRST